MKGKISEKELKKLDPLAADLRHEVRNPLNVIEGHLELAEENSSSKLQDASREERQLIEDFCESAEYIVAHTDLMGTIPEEYVNEIEDYVNRESFPESFEISASRIVSVSRSSLNYQKKLMGENGDESTSVAELLEPLENCADNLERAEQNFEYNQLEDCLTGVDTGMKILFWTLGKNWENHAGPIEGNYELGFEVSERKEDYLVEVWNTGEGLFEEYPGNNESQRKSRHDLAHQYFEQQDYGGHGLGMANDIAEVYGGSLDYSEERLEGKGFGLEVEIPRFEAQNSTSDPS